MNIKRDKGFTLIEMMIVVAIIGIIAAIAYPNYQNSVQNSRRVAATACLLDLSQFMERFYTSNLTYVGATLPVGGCRTENDLNTFYTISFTAAPTARAYTIQAVNVGAQSSDACGTLSINQAGVRTVTSGTVTQCW